MFVSIDVQTQSATTGRFGTTDNTWTTSYTIAGEVRQLTARQNAEGFDQGSIQVVLPYTPSTTIITTNNRLVIQGVNYSITNVDTFTRNRRQVWISAVARGGNNE